MLTVGDRPENFVLRNQDDEDVAWADLRGAPVVVFFYPKANTPGCTKEACAFRDLAPAFAERGVAILGVSADTVRRQHNFTTKYALDMPLLADTEHTVLEPWGVWAEKRNYGRTYMGIMRATFLFNADGVVTHAWPKVKVTGHVDDVLAVIDQQRTEAETP